jgi:hypothetical protein
MSSAMIEGASRSSRGVERSSTTYRMTEQTTRPPGRRAGIEDSQRRPVVQRRLALGLIRLRRGTVTRAQQSENGDD